MYLMNVEEVKQKKKTVFLDVFIFPKDSTWYICTELASFIRVISVQRFAISC